MAVVLARRKNGGFSISYPFRHDARSEMTSTQGHAGALLAKAHRSPRVIVIHARCLQPRDSHDTGASLASQLEYLREARL